MLGNPTTRKKISKCWVDYQYSKEGESRKQLFWSWEALDELIKTAPEEAWAIINEIRDLDGTDYVLSNLAAGPLEDLLGYHGDIFIERIEDLSRQDTQFRKLLGAVWQGRMSEAIWVRIKAVAGPPF